MIKTDISLSDLIFAEAEALAQQLRRSRSELYTEALKVYLQRDNREQILSKLNFTLNNLRMVLFLAGLGKIDFYKK